VKYARPAAIALVALFSMSDTTLAQDWRAPRATSGASPAVEAQAPASVSLPAAAPQAPRMVSPRQLGQLLNVKVEFTITDQVGSKPPVKKTMTMVVADRESSRIRTNVEFSYALARKNDKGEPANTGTQRGLAPLSVDVSPVIEGNKVRLEFSIEYSAADMDADGNLGSKTTVSERLAAVLDSGVPLVVAQSSDAYSDRKVTVEIKATILK
jgi:hypothetical protein